MDAIAQGPTGFGMRFRSLKLKPWAWRLSSTGLPRRQVGGENHAPTHHAKRSQESAPSDRVDTSHVRLMIRHPNTPYDTQTPPRGGFARMLMALLPDGATGHARRFRDTKTARRILSSEKARPYPEIAPPIVLLRTPEAPVSPTPAVARHGVSGQMRTVTGPTVLESFALTPPDGPLREGDR